MAEAQAKPKSPSPQLQESASNSSVIILGYLFNPGIIIASIRLLEIKNGSDSNPGSTFQIPNIANDGFKGSDSFKSNAGIDSYKQSNETIKTSNNDSYKAASETARTGESYKTGSTESYKSAGDSYKPAANESYKPVGDSYKPSTTDSYKSSTDTYKPTSESYKSTGDSYKTTAESYKPSESTFKSSANENYKPSSESYKTVSDTYMSSQFSSEPSMGDVSKSSNFQSQSRSNMGNSGYQSQGYQPPSNYQQSYQSPKQPSQPPPQLKREASSTNLTTPRSNAYQSASGPSLQRQQSSANAGQRPYMPSSAGQPRPAAPTVTQRPSQQLPRQQSNAYNPSNTSSYSALSNTGRSGQSLPQGFNNPGRNPVAQRPAPIVAPNIYATETSSPVRTTSGVNYPSRSPESGQWPAGDASTNSAGRNYPSNYLHEDDKKPVPLGSTKEGDIADKPGFQAKFKALVGKNIPAPGGEPAARTPNLPGDSDATIDTRTITRTGSEVKVLPPLLKRDSVITDDKRTADDNHLSKPPDVPISSHVEEESFNFGENGILTIEDDETFVKKSVKYFEAKDKAKVPLIPKSPTFEKKDKPQRPTHIDIPVVNRDTGFSDEEDDGGVDDSPVKHPNLRSIVQPPKKVARISSGNSRRKGTSYPGTPTRIASAPASALSTPHTPKRQIHSARFKTEEELYRVFGSPVKKTRFVRNVGAENGTSDVGKENRPRPNGVLDSPRKTPSKIPSSSRKVPTSPTKTPLKSPGVPKAAPKTPESPNSATPLVKKVPMNKVQVGAAPAPNLREVKSKIGSLANTTHRPGGGNIKIESHKIDYGKSAQSRIAAKNDAYAPSGGEKKIQQVKLQWNAKPKVGSLENASYKPGGGAKKIESVKLDFKDKAKSKVGSKDNVHYTPGGGSVKNSASHPERKQQNIENHKLEYKAQSKVGSLDNVKHQPGGGDVKIFDDKEYIKQISAQGSGTQNEVASLSVEREISASADATDISIKKTTTVSNTKPEISKTTHVTVVTRSPSKERKELEKTPSTHEIKLTYSAVSSPTKQRTNPVNPVQVVKVPALENAPILNPSVKDSGDIKPELPPFLSSSGDKKETGKREVEQNTVKGKNYDANVEESPISKFVQNEMTTHEKVGEIWKEVQNVDFPQQQPFNDSQLKQTPNTQENSNKPALQQPQPQAQPRPLQTQQQQGYPQNAPAPRQPAMQQRAPQPFEQQRPPSDSSFQRPQQPSENAPPISKQSNSRPSDNSLPNPQQRTPQQFEHPQYSQQRPPQQPDPTLPIQRPIHAETVLQRPPPQPQPPSPRFNAPVQGLRSANPPQQRFPPPTGYQDPNRPPSSGPQTNPPRGPQLEQYRQQTPIASDSK